MYILEYTMKQMLKYKSKHMLNRQGGSRARGFLEGASFYKLTCLPSRKRTVKVLPEHHKFTLTGGNDAENSVGL